MSTPENARKYWYRQNAVRTHALNGVPGDFSTSVSGIYSILESHKPHRHNRLGRGTPCRKQKFDQYSAITWKRCKIGCKLVLITNRKLHMGFWLVPKSVTLNDLEQHNGPYFALFHWILELRGFISSLAIFTEVTGNECIIKWQWWLSCRQIAGLHHTVHEHVVLSVHAESDTDHVGDMVADRQFLR